MRASPSREDGSIKTFAFVGLISLALLLSCESHPFLSKPSGKPGEVEDQTHRVKELRRAIPKLEPEFEHVAFDPWARDRGDYYDLEWKPRRDATGDEASSWNVFGSA